MHTTTTVTARSHRPRALTVFGSAFVAGAVAAFGVNSVLDAHLAASRPQVESDSILVAIRALPAGAPVTVWDVALKDWPKALVPTAAMRVTDGLEGLVARQPLREGQPILAVQVERVGTEENRVPRGDVVSALATPPALPERDLWDPAETPVRRPDPAPPRERPAAAAIEPRSVATVVPPTPSTPSTTPPAAPTTVAAMPSTSLADAAPTGASTAPVAGEAAVPPAMAAVAETSAPAAEAPRTETFVAREPLNVTADAPLALPAAPPTDSVPATIEPRDPLPLVSADPAPAPVVEAPDRTETVTATDQTKRQRPASSSTRFLDVPAPEAFAGDNASADPMPAPRRAGRGSAAEEVSVVDRHTAAEAERSASSAAPARGVRQGESTAKRPSAQAARKPSSPGPRSSGMSRGYRTR